MSAQGQNHILTYDFFLDDLSLFYYSLVCAGPNYSHSQLWSGNSVGQITLWNVPYSGLEFTPLKTWRGHEGTVQYFLLDVSLNLLS